MKINRQMNKHIKSGNIKYRKKTTLYEREKGKEEQGNLRETNGRKQENK